MKKRVLSAIFAVFFCISLFIFPVSAQEDAKGIVIDPTGHYSEDDTKMLVGRAQEFADHTGMNMVIYLTFDIGTDKSDHHVVEFADDAYEEYCGINTDGVLLLINCDTLYDYVSTSGAGINYYSDARIDALLSYINPQLKDEDYVQAAYRFIARAESYCDQGKANHQVEIAGNEFDPFYFVMIFGRFILFAVIIGAVIFAVLSKQYKMEKPGTRRYMMKNSLAFDVKTDTFIQNVTTRTYSPRSSSSGGSHRSGGHHSSTHHSSSGGRHGGGGRHR